MRVAVRMGVAILLAAVACLTFAGVEEEDDSPWPCIVMVYQANSMLPGVGGSGLRMAIWEDGSILMQPDRSISEHILIGSLDGEDLETAFKSIVQTGFFSGSREGYVVPDAGYSTLMIRTETESKVRSWHGKLSPGFGGNLNTDKEYRRFVKMWKASESTLLALTPVKVERLAQHLKKSGATHFRGYNPQAPFEAPWISKWNWRDQESASESLKDLLQEPPIVALWLHADHRRSRSTAPNLRIAVWNDGRVLSAQDPSKWGHQLELGRLTDDTLSKVKKQIQDTGVFDLKGRLSYLVPSAPVFCLLVQLDGKRQLLRWDEREMAGYGANTNPTVDYLAFKEAWKSVNKIAVSAVPDDSVQVVERFETVPKPWHVERRIRSE